MIQCTANDTTNMVIADTPMQENFLYTVDFLFFLNLDAIHCKHGSFL